MAKKKGGQTSSEPPGEGDGDTRASDSPDANADQSPEVEAAERTVREAEAQLRKAQDLYYQIRQQATDRLKWVREKRVADLVDETLKLVKKHPGLSLVIAGFIGFWLGRLFRR